MGCIFVKGAAPQTAPIRDFTDQHAGSAGNAKAVLWLRVLQLENVPDCDIHPFDHGDFYCKYELQLPGARPDISIAGTGARKSSYARGHFTPITAGSLVKFDHMIAFEMPAGITVQGLNAPGSKLHIRVFDKDSSLWDNVDDLVGSVEVYMCIYVRSKWVLHVILLLLLLLYKK